MTTHIQRLILFFMFILVPLHALAEPEDDTLMARVRIKANMKLDAQARKDIAAAAAKIKKSKSGTVKLRGIYPSASSSEEYLSKSVFMAREVEKYLKTLLPPRQQIYTVASQFSPEKMGTQNVVEILLYPFELKAAEVEDFRVTTVESRDIGESSPPRDGGKPAGTDAGTSSIQPSVEKSVTPDRRDTGRAIEDARRAEELVRRAKERAAAKAKRKADDN